MKIFIDDAVKFNLENLNDTLIEFYSTMVFGGDNSTVDLNVLLKLKVKAECLRNVLQEKINYYDKYNHQITEEDYEMLEHLNDALICIEGVLDGR